MERRKAERELKSICHKVMLEEFRHLSEFINKVDVHCPNCSKKALISSNPENRNQTRFICAHCGSNKEWIGQGNVILSSKSELAGYSGVHVGTPTDPYFGFSLWYTTLIKEEALFAYNLDHLQFLEVYITDKLRKRRPNEHGWSNQSLQSRLPKWLLSAKNRDLILAKIKELKSK
uniref:hypothetical protein n=1 Tax=Roseivirga sp. TaxID=1964215 RepID=UPI0040470D6B